MKKWLEFGISLFNLLILIFLINLVSAQNISVDFPSEVSYGGVFKVNLTLIGFNSDVYDVKIDITNSSGQRIAKIWDGSRWQSTYYYVNNIINTSEQNSSSFLLNITEIYNGTADMEIRVKNGEIGTFSNYVLDVSYQEEPEQNQADQNQTQNGIEEDEEQEIYLEAKWEESKIVNGDEFEIEIKAFNLKNQDYNVKVYITFEDNDTIISDRYDEEKDEWKSGMFYVDNLFSGPGNKSKDILLRIRDGYKEFVGNATLKIKIEDEDYIFENNIEILEKNEGIKKEKIEENEKTNSLKETENAGLENQVIKLNNPKDIKIRENYKTAYKSKTQLIREYAIYGFALFCVFVIIVLLIRGYEK